METDVSIGPGKNHCKELVIGHHSYIRSGFELYGKLSIGRYCSLGNNLVIGIDRDEHPLNWLSNQILNPVQTANYHRDRTKKINKTIIENDCWIGRDAFILSGVTIGNGSVIAARAVVTKDVPPYAIVAGSPARVIRYRFSEDIIDMLLKSQWWNIDDKYLSTLDFSNLSECLIKLTYAKNKSNFPRILITNNKKSFLNT
jgi:acetyltransferase-like isoleucine patch superfamily enzyme